MSPAPVDSGVVVTRPETGHDPRLGGQQHLVQRIVEIGSLTEKYVGEQIDIRTQDRAK